MVDETNVIPLYRVVYDAIHHDLAQPDGRGALNDKHRKFALSLPRPDAVSVADAAALCSLVMMSGEWGLEVFCAVTETTSGLFLGDIIRRKLPSYPDHQARAQELVAEYRRTTSAGPST